MENIQPFWNKVDSKTSQVESTYTMIHKKKKIRFLSHTPQGDLQPSKLSFWSLAAGEELNHQWQADKNNLCIYSITSGIYSYVMLPKHCETLIFSLSCNQHVTSKWVSEESSAFQTLTEQTSSMLWNEKMITLLFWVKFYLKYMVDNWTNPFRAFR